MTFRKITGDTRLSLEEQKHLEEIKKSEKPKGYVEPEILIPKLQDDIAKTQFTFDCLINENKSKTLEEPSIKSLLLKSNKENFYDINKLNVTKQINFGEDMNNKNNKNDKSTSNNFNIITSSIDTTTIPLDTKNIAIKTPRYNIFTRKKTHTTILMSPFRRKLQSNTSHFAEFFNNEFWLIFQCTLTGLKSRHDIRVENGAQ